VPLWHLGGYLRNSSSDDMTEQPVNPSTVIYLGVFSRAEQRVLQVIFKGIAEGDGSCAATLAMLASRGHESDQAEDDEHVTKEHPLRRSKLTTTSKRPSSHSGIRVTCPPATGVRDAAYPALQLRPAKIEHTRSLSDCNLSGFGALSGTMKELFHQLLDVAASDRLVMAAALAISAVLVVAAALLVAL
jgi:hypothetical protein